MSDYETSASTSDKLPSRRLRPWGKYAFVSSALMVISLISCVVFWFATFSFDSAGPSHILSFLFYASIGFGISSLTFATIAFCTGRNKLYAGLSLIGPVLLVGGIILVRLLFGV